MMLLQADAALIPLKDNSVHCVVTSPPYWGLRKYAGEQDIGEFPNLGLEPTPQEHIERMVTIFREVKRVLRDDGVVYLNYGDCYAGSGGENANTGLGSGDRSGLYRSNPRREKIPAGNLMLMPHRVAIALQDDGWIVRNDLIWFKRNPMPESCAGWRFERSRTKVGNRGRGGEDWRDNATETPQQRHGPDGTFLQDAIYEYGEDYELRKGSWRHTRAHEYIFMLTKKMQYWCNQEAVRESTIPDPRDKMWCRSERTTFHDHSDDDSKGMSQPKTQAEGFWRMSNPSGRNPRSVLDVPTAPYKGAHYATFPPNLIAPLIRASCPRRACPECGQGWAPVIERQKGQRNIEQERRISKELTGRTDGKTIPAGGGNERWDKKSVIDYRPTCECGHDEYVPGITLDPFIGSGTTGAVARELQRRWVGLDISMEYLDQQAKIRALNLTPSNALDELPLFNL